MALTGRLPVPGQSTGTCSDFELHATRTPSPASPVTGTSTQTSTVTSTITIPGTITSDQCLNLQHAHGKAIPMCLNPSESEVKQSESPLVVVARQSRRMIQTQRHGLPADERSELTPAISWSLHSISTREFFYAPWSRESTKAGLPAIVAFR